MKQRVQAMKKSRVSAKEIGMKAGTTKKGTKSRSASKAKTDDRMALGRGWRLIPKDGKTAFAATLLATYDLGDRYVALFKSNA